MSEYDPKKIAITGGLGFIGGHFVRHCLQVFPGTDLVIFDRSSYAANVQNLIAFQNHSNIQVIRGSVCNYSAVSNAIADCDAVVHFAAETHVPRSFLDPSLFFETNSYGSKVIAAACLENRVERMVHISTDEVYGSTDFKVTEDAIFRPTTAYAKSKVAAEHSIEHARQSGLDALILRPTNVIGVGQHLEKVLPKFVELALQGKPLPIEGDGLQTRTFLPVTDAVHAIDLALRRAGVSQTLNISGEEIISIYDLANTVIELLGSDSNIEFVKDRIVNDQSYLIDDASLRSMGYRQKSNLQAEILHIAGSISGIEANASKELAS